MADAHFEDRRLAKIYGPLDPDRNDLDQYIAIGSQFAVASVLDIGCGTGTFAYALTQLGEASGRRPRSSWLANEW